MPRQGRNDTTGSGVFVLFVRIVVHIKKDLFGLRAVDGSQINLAVLQGSGKYDVPVLVITAEHLAALTAFIAVQPGIDDAMLLLISSMIDYLRIVRFVFLTSK